MTTLSNWKAAAWRGTIRRCVRHSAPVPLEAREQGETPTSYYPEPLTHCAVCGCGLWHWWQFADGDGNVIDVGDECARIVTGGEPPSAVAAGLRERRAADEMNQREAFFAADRRNWWRAPERRTLRRVVLCGRWEERKHFCSDYFRRAYSAARDGRLSEQWQAVIERLGDGRAAAWRARAASALASCLGWVRAGRFDQNIVRDLCDRIHPPHGDGLWAPPVSEAQLGLLVKLARRYRKQWVASDLIRRDDKALAQQLTA